MQVAEVAPAVEPDVQRSSELVLRRDPAPKIDILVEGDTPQMQVVEGGIGMARAEIPHFPQTLEALKARLGVSKVVDVGPKIKQSRLQAHKWEAGQNPAYFDLAKKVEQTVAGDLGISDDFIDVWNSGSQEDFVLYLTGIRVRLTSSSAFYLPAKEPVSNIERNYIFLDESHRMRIDSVVNRGLSQNPLERAGEIIALSHLAEEVGHAGLIEMTKGKFIPSLFLQELGVCFVKEWVYNAYIENGIAPDALDSSDGRVSLRGTNVSAKDIVLNAQTVNELSDAQKDSLNHILAHKIMDLVYRRHGGPVNSHNFKTFFRNCFKNAHDEKQVLYSLLGLKKVNGVLHKKGDSLITNEEFAQLTDLERQYLYELT